MLKTAAFIQGELQQWHNQGAEDSALLLLSAKVQERPRKPPKLSNFQGQPCNRAPPRSEKLQWSKDKAGWGISPHCSTTKSCHCLPEQASKAHKPGRHGPGEALACTKSSRLPEEIAMRRTAPRLDLMALSLNGLQQPCSKNTPSQPKARALHELCSACAHS